METPKISVIVPVYNTAPYLRRCLDSVTGQSYRNLEILLVDDGSTDGSGGICDEYAARDGRIRVKHQPNRGLSTARNAGLEEAEGLYICFVDSDDAISGDYIDSLYRACTDAAAEIAQCDFCIEEALLGTGVSTHIEYTGFEMSERLCEGSQDQYAVIWNKLYARKLFNGIRFPDGRIHEDEATVYRLLWKADKCAVLGRRLYFYRQRQGSIVHTSFTPRNMAAAEAYRERIVFYERNGAIKLSDYTKSVYCYFLRKNIAAIRRMCDDSQFWESEMHNAYSSVMKSKELPVKKKLGLSIHMLSPKTAQAIKWFYK